MAARCFTLQPYLTVVFTSFGRLRGDIVSFSGWYPAAEQGAVPFRSERFQRRLADAPPMQGAPVSAAGMQQACRPEQMRVQRFAQRGKIPCTQDAQDLKVLACTLVHIAQRIDSVRDADRILVLDEGRLSGFGTHDELLANNAIYREVYEGQTRGGGDFDGNGGED